MSKLNEETAAIRAQEKENMTVLEMIANMSDGEVFLYGSTYNEKMVIQCDELHRMFCYHEELHMSKGDDTQKFHLALQSIQLMLDGTEWQANLLSDIAEVLRQAGYEVRDIEA